MRRIGFVLLSLLAVCPIALTAQSAIDFGSLVRRGDNYLHPRTLEPYRGEVVSFWTPDRVSERGTMVNGRWDGVHEWFHINGQLSSREIYVDGQLNGPSTSYFKNGQLSIQETYKDGQRDGAYESFWSKGRLAEQGIWTAGERCGEWSTFGDVVMHPACPG
jgi:hypothetical protein